MIDFKTFVLLQEAFGTDITKKFLNLFSNFKINMKRDNKTLRFQIDPIDLDGVLESIKRFFKDQKGKERKHEPNQLSSWILGTTLVDIFKPKKIGKQLEMEVVFN